MFITSYHIISHPCVCFNSFIDWKLIFWTTQHVTWWSPVHKSRRTMHIFQNARGFGLWKHPIKPEVHFSSTKIENPNTWHWHSCVVVSRCIKMYQDSSHLIKLLGMQWDIVESQCQLPWKLVFSGRFHRAFVDLRRTPQTMCQEANPPHVATDYPCQSFCLNSGR